MNHNDDMQQRAAGLQGCLGSRFFEEMERFFALAQGCGVAEVSIDCASRRVSLRMAGAAASGAKDGSCYEAAAGAKCGSCYDGAASGALLGAAPGAKDGSGGAGSYFDMLQGRFWSKVASKAQNGLERWKGNLLKEPTVEMYKNFLNAEVKKLLDSGFLKVEDWVHTDEDLCVARELKGFGIKDEDEEAYRERYGLLRQLLDLKNGRFVVNEKVVSRYLSSRSEVLTDRAMSAFFLFLCYCKLVYAEMDMLMVPESKELGMRRTMIVQQLLCYVEKGDWLAPATVEKIQQFLREALGLTDRTFTPEEQAMSDTLWGLLKSGRGDPVKVTMQKLIAYFVSRGWLTKGSPTLNETFFGTADGYTNIDKGNPSNPAIQESYKQVLPLLDSIRL